MKAFMIDAGFHRCVEDNLGEIGVIMGEGWFGGVVYAETASKAKHLFITECNNRYERPGLEYTDKMSIRVLATEATEKWTPHVSDAYEYEVSDWMRGKLSKYGGEVHQKWIADAEYR